LIIAGIVLVVLILTATAAVALWQRDGEAEARGTCEASAAAFAELSVEPDDGALEVSAEIDGLGPGDVWQVRLVQGEVSLIDGERTADDEGEIDLDAVAREAAGDTFVFEATGQNAAACRVSVER